jgi:hypothetical protein
MFGAVGNGSRYTIFMPLKQTATIYRKSKISNFHFKMKGTKLLDVMLCSLVDKY